MLGGFDYALRNRERLGIRVLNNSWGDTSDTGDFNPDDPINVATKALNDQGVVIVFSAGNAGPNPGTISGNYKKAPWVICVASANDQRVPANSSSRGVKDKTVVVTGNDGTVHVSEDRPTVTAPGVSILAARASGGTFTPAFNFAPWYTSLSGTSMAAPILPDDDGDTHGVGTSSAVLRANPDAIVLFVEGITAAAETFTMNHPEVDIVTTSYGPIGSIPLPEHLTSSYTGVVRNGKLHFGAADNSPSTAMQDATAGPWWSIGIAGFEEGSSEGRQVLSGSFPDFVGDFYQEMPYCHDCESGLEWHAGTSFADHDHPVPARLLGQPDRHQRELDAGLRPVRLLRAVEGR